MSFSFKEPPTSESLADARRYLEETKVSTQDITNKIDAAEATLAQIIRDSRCAIKELEAQRAAVEEKARHTLAYLSPIRRIPAELLREIFMWNFEDCSSCGWTLAAVCASWRRQVLRMPRMWSKIRLVTTQQSSADVIRLWLERSGQKGALDIEIYLRTGDFNPNSDTMAGRRRRRVSSFSSPTSPTMPSWGPMPSQHIIPSHYVIPHTHSLNHGFTIHPQSNTPVVIPSSQPLNQDPMSASQSEQMALAKSKSMHWGHIALFYLVEQMHRWERFVFRYDRQFASISALKSITGDAPLLKEFEVTSTEAPFHSEWPWLPNTSAQSSNLPNLQTLSLHHVPFKWCSPIFKTSLQSLSLRALPTYNLSIDRILHIISNNPCLKKLTLNFQTVLPAILPLTTTTLPELESLSIGGHHLLGDLLDTLVLPALTHLTLDVDARDAVDDLITNLLTRSKRPPIAHLSIAHSPTNSSNSFYYGPSGMIVSWTSLLSELGSLRTLQIGASPLEPLLSALCAPDDDNNQLQTWMCPLLESLSMRGCHSHSEGVSKLVQVVHARNPDNGTASIVNGVSPVKLKLVEMNDCCSLGQDVINWLSGKVEKVFCTEPAFER